MSTGKKVNSAIDNPSSYYTAQSLTNRASDLSGLLDSMGQAISTIKAADEGIEAITSFVEQAKAVASSAAETKNEAERAKYMEQYNNIRDQINQLAKDSGYKGVNLINGDSLTVTFNEDRTSNLVISSQNATTGGLGMDAAASWASEVTVTGNTIAVTKEADGSITADATLTAGKVIEVDGTKYKYTGAEVAADGVIDMSQTEKLTESGGKYYGLASTTSDDAVKSAITKSTEAINKLRTMSSELGNNYSIVETRESFTENLVNVLEEGADKLTLADMNEESANMLALQTRQQLAINSLSLASQAAQSVLSLF